VVLHPGLDYFFHFEEFFLHGLHFLVVLDLDQPQLDDLLLQLFDVLLVEVVVALALGDGG